jgi:hypothetical protein
MTRRNRRDRLIQRVDLSRQRRERNANVLGNHDLTVFVRAAGQHPLQPIGVLGALGRHHPDLAQICDSLLHRIRGEILLKHDPANTAPAEEAFLAAIAVAQAQKAKSFELQAALALAKLYQSTGRPAYAYAVLAPALEGFSPTPEMPEIAEAQTLLERLA